MRRTFNDLKRLAKVEAVVTKSISGHQTDRVREHYSTVTPDAGLAPQQIVESYPTVTLDDVLAAVANGAELARERVIDLRAAGG